MKKEIKYAAVFYYEHHYAKKGVYQIHVRIPDLLAAGLPASTVGVSLEDAIEAVKEVLEMIVEFAGDEAIVLPDPTPIEEMQIHRGLDLDEEPFRILVEHVSIYL